MFGVTNLDAVRNVKMDTTQLIKCKRCQHGKDEHDKHGCYHSDHNSLSDVLNLRQVLCDCKGFEA